MQRSFFASVLLAGLLVSMSQAQDKKEKVDVPKKIDPPKKIDEPTTKKTSNAGGTAPASADIPGDVEINFLNGSRIRAIILTDKLEIISIYGKLSVPIQDVQSIEFGLHYPEGVEAKIDLAIKNLASGDYREREKAGRTLVELGPFAYPAVVRTTKVKESEVAARAKDIVAKLQAKHPKKDLKLSTDDRVVTPTQTLVGRITTQSVKTRAEYFGEIDHKLAHMRTLRAFLKAGPEIDVAVDAGKYANSGQWLDTNFQLDGRSTISITAKGQVDTWPQQPGQYMTGPGGGMAGGGRFGGGGFGPGGGGMQVAPGTKIRLQGNVGQLYGGMLIGKIGEDGEPFIIGDRYDFKSEAEGKLYLHIAPSPWNCASSGAYEVKISRKND